MTCDLTVYILNYNYSEYISEAVLSVLKQSHKNFEFFIIDDGSTDDSLKIINKFQKQYTFDVVIQKNSGMINSINIALQRAKGEYILRLDADDYLSENAILEYSKLLSSNEYAYVFSGYNIVDINNNIISYEHLNNHDDFKNHIPHGGGLFVNVEMLRQIGGYGGNCTIDDGKYIYENLSSGNINYIDKPLFNYRLHYRNTSILKQIDRFNFNH